MADSRNYAGWILYDFFVGERRRKEVYSGSGSLNEIAREDEEILLIIKEFINQAA